MLQVSICSHSSNGTWVMGFLPNASSASIVSATITSWAKDNCPKKAKNIVIKPNLKYLFVFISFIFIYFCIIVFLSFYESILFVVLVALALNMSWYN